MTSMLRLAVLIVAFLSFRVGSRITFQDVSCTAYFKELTNQTSYLLCPPKCDVVNTNICGSGPYPYGQICTAAIHNGKLSRSEGGLVLVSRSSAKITKSVGSYSHGVNSTACLTSGFLYSFPIKAVTASAYYAPSVDGSCLVVQQNNIVDHCSKIGASCLNGGSCVNGASNFTCKCSYGFNGSNCETDIYSCAHKVCQNGGSCVTLMSGSSICSCIQFFTGPYCNLIAQSCLAGVYSSSIVSDAQMTASGYANLSYPYRARLYTTRTPEGWTASPIGTGGWLQVDFRKSVRLFGIITKGCTCNQWVTKFSVSYGDAVGNMKFITDLTNQKAIFSTSQYWFEEATNHFFMSPMARFWRFYVEEYIGAPTVQLDYFTC